MSFGHDARAKSAELQRYHCSSILFRASICGSLSFVASSRTFFYYIVHVLIISISSASKVDATHFPAIKSQVEGTTDTPTHERRD